MSKQETEQLPDNVHDLEEYRRRRMEEGSWPPDEHTLVEYWRSFRKNRRKTSR